VHSATGKQVNSKLVLYQGTVCNM